MSHHSRRDFLASAAALAAGTLFDIDALAGPATTVTAPPSVRLSWLGGQAPLLPAPVAWGVPWPRGAVDAKAALAVRDGNGDPIAAQTWTMARWPDGSVKWSGVAIAAHARTDGVTVSAGGGRAAPATPLSVMDGAEAVEIDTGTLQARIARHGASLIASLRVAGREVARDGRLVALREDRAQYQAQGVLRQQAFTSAIEKVTVEQSGPVRAVVHIEGRHAGHGRQWLPFSVRLYFTAGLATVRMLHTFVFDGDQSNDFIKGLGLAFAVPFREETQNRHVRFATDDGNLFSEPVLLAPGYRPAVMQHAAAYETAQLEGKRIPNLADLPAASRTSMLGTATWDGFKIRQLGADGWDLYKRTGAASSWLHVTGGRRARGLAFLGDVSGGLAVGVKRFWQKYPAAFEVGKAATGTGELTVWFWSPDADAMDLRHYDTVGHAPDVTYEDGRTAARANAYGCANTAELTLWATPDTPAPQVFDAMARSASEPALLICPPRHYYDSQALGVWSLPGTPAPGLSDADIAASEAQLDRAFAFYNGEIERRRWYGFWDHGDYRRTYDPLRHQWMYDIGGHGWNATELVPNVWLWFAFLRSGRADIFRAAEDMTRNTSEVDVYHIGPFAGVGSRHNVSHWGDGAKEPRINQAYLKRFYYYLTTDERMGDLLREPLATVEQTVGRYLNNEPAQGRDIAIRLAPDWQTFASNWFTEWERTGDVRYRDYCLTGMRDIGAMREQDVAAGGFYFDTISKHLRPRGASGNEHFLILFSGDQIIHELLANIPCPAFERAWNRRLQNFVLPSEKNGYFESRMMAYVAMTTGRRDIAARAVRLFKDLLRFGDQDYFIASPHRIDGPRTMQPALENPGNSSFTPIIATPEVAQWALNLLTATEWMRRVTLTVKD